MATYLEALEGIIGELNSKNVEKIRSLNRRKYQDLSFELYMQLTRAIEMPQRTFNQLRPYVTRNLQERGLTDEKRAVKDLYETMGVPDPNEIELLIRQLSRQLLYCNSLAIADPIRLGKGFTGRTIEGFTAKLEFLRLVRPWLVEGLLVIVPDVTPDLTRYDIKELLELVEVRPVVDVAWSKLGAEEFEAMEDWPYDVFLPEADERAVHRRVVTGEMRKLIEGATVKERFLINQSLRRTAWHMGLAETLARGVDVWLADPLDEVVIQELAARRVRDQSMMLPRPAARHLRAIVDLPRFGLDDADVDTLVKLHRYEDIFSKWRAAVASALERIANQQEYSQAEGRDHFGNSLSQRDVAYHFAEATTPVVEEMLSQKKKIELSLGASSLQQVVFAAIPVGAAAVSGSVATGLGAAGSIGALTMAWGYAMGRRNRHVGDLGRKLQQMMSD